MKRSQNPYPRRSWLLTWLHLPVDLWRIRTMRPTDAVEIVRYLERRGGKRLHSEPMQRILVALRRRGEVADALA